MRRAFLLFLLIPQLSFSANWLVGPSRTYTKPSQVSTLVAAGDTVNIDSATYTADVCKWTASNLLIRGVGDRPILNANNTSYGRKGIFVIDGNNCIVDNIEFSNCHDINALDLNWAGIRFEASGITISHCYFHDNDDGILDNGVSTAPIVIEFTEFSHNGYGDGYSHNLYIGHSDTLIFQYNYSHLAHIGHELKSRAHVNYVLYNRFSNEATGDASHEMDLPNGGYTIVMGNVIEQGLNSTNSGIIEYGLEGLTNPSPHNFYFINNTVVNDKNSGTFMTLQSGMDLYKANNNIFAGAGTLLSGTATVIDTSNNWRAIVVASCAFLNAANYDYHLTCASLGAIDIGANAGTANNGFSLTPTVEYKHPIDSVSRINNGQIDIGAYELSLVSTVNEIENNLQFKFFVLQRTLQIVYLSSTTSSFKILDLNGRCLKEGIVSEGKSEINLFDFKCGIYFLDVFNASTRTSSNFFIN